MVEKNPKILALGGAGDMGRMAVAILLEYPKIDSITIADKNIEQSNKFIEEVDSDKLIPVKIDINQKNELKELISSHDVVINTVGPFFKFEMPILNAILEVKKPYLDICDDWKPTLKALEKSNLAKKSNISSIIGIGASPGITNLMAMYACSKLDEVDELITAWGEAVQIKEGKKPKYYVKPKKLIKNSKEKNQQANAAVVHLLYETLENIPTFKDGKMTKIEPLMEAKEFDFPGYKAMYACHIGHPEPITLPRTIKARTISNLMYIGETATGLTRNYRQKIRDKQLSIEEASIQLMEDFRALNKRARMGRSPLKEYLGGPPTLSVLATGRKNNKMKKIGVALDRNPYGQMAGVTGVPLAIATIMLIEGKIIKKGVLTPEEAINPIEFFENLAPYCGKNLSATEILVEREIDL